MPADQPRPDPREQMLRYLDGSLPPEEVTRLNAILKSGPALRRDFAELVLQQVQLAELGRSAQAGAAGLSKLVPFQTDDDSAASQIVQPASLSAGSELSTPVDQRRFSPSLREAPACRLSAGAQAGDVCGAGRGRGLGRGAIWPQRPLPSLALAASIVLLLGLSFWFFGPTIGEPVLAEVQGNDAVLERNGETVTVTPSTRLQLADVLRTGTNSGATITFGRENTQFSVHADTELKLMSLTRGKRFHLRTGKLQATVARQRPLRPMMITTPNAEARVIGTRFTLTATTNHTRLDVTEGRVRLTRVSDALAVKVGASQYAIVANGTRLSALPVTGEIVGEYWTNVPGVYVRSLEKDSRFPDHPDNVIPVKNFQAPSDWGDNYGARFRAYVHPPLTGEYTLWAAGRNEFFLFVSPDDNPKGSQCVCYGSNIQPRDWDLPQRNEKAMQSVPIHMEAGRKYYVEALLKAAVGEDHLAVAWRVPGGEREVIPGKFLSPFKPKEKKR